VDARQEAIDYLRSHHVVSIATLGADGPAAAAVFYVNQGTRLYFLSAPHSLHCRNFMADARVALTIQEDYSDWSAIKGIQIDALVRELEGEEKEEAKRLYGEKFPGVLGDRPVLAALAEAVRKVRWYEAAAQRIRFINNQRGFGHKEEWSAAEFSA
jgi:uncharacterized protein YhbP (UPF0306 family)